MKIRRCEKCGKPIPLGHEHPLCAFCQNIFDLEETKLLKKIKRVFK